MMRLQLTLDHPPNQVLPINYQYLISSWIYRTLGNADATYAGRLHDLGYDFGSKKYKLFTFGPLVPVLYQIDQKNRAFILRKGPSQLQLSFFVDEALQKFVLGLFQNQQFVLRSGRFGAAMVVQEAITLPPPFFKTSMRFRTLSPVCIGAYEANQEHAQYRSPLDKDYAQLLLMNLWRKQQAISKKRIGVGEALLPLGRHGHFECLSKVRSKLITFKKNQYRGYHFDFSLTAPTDLLELGYYAGFGEKNSGVGMGMVQVLN
ncbi:MAG: CRISPR-associated endoribonuclease Cas6 [Bacteroidota bacterium]